MDETVVVSGFLHNRGDVLLLQRSDAVDSYQGKWGAVAGHAEDDPAAAIRREIREETGIDPERVEQRQVGEPFAVEDPNLDTRWIVHPFLFETETRAVTPNWETARYEWCSPTAILHRETVPDLWASYDRVRPTVEDVSGDMEHGAATLSLFALEHLRDEAALFATGRREGGWPELADVAGRLLAARPAMCVIANRINRVMDAIRDERTPAVVERRAHEACHRAVWADAAAGANARSFVADARVATLSRSGTVLDALISGMPAAVLVAESRPGREGIGVAEELSAGLGEDTVTVTSDAAFPSELAAWDADVLLVGADTILADGRVLNKVGTYPATAVAGREGVEVVVVAATDKISPDTTAPREYRDASEIYDGERGIDVRNPTFDLTLPSLVDAVSTEGGIVDGKRVRSIAAEQRARADWRR